MYDIWNEICYELKSCIHKDVLEKEYEHSIANCMVHLGWKKYRGEIITQYSVQQGHGKKYADIVITKDGVEQFVIEVKRPSHTMQQEDRKQLFSYMRLLNHQVDFGLYIGDKIRLFYDNHTSAIEEVFSIDILENNPDGITFVKLFSKESFNIQTLSDFCVAQQEKKNHISCTEKALEDFFSDTQYEENIKMLLKEKFINEGFEENIVRETVDNIRLFIQSFEEYRHPIIDKRDFNEVPSKGKGSKDKKPEYSLNNSTPLKQGRFVLALVRKYIEDNPTVTYVELLRVFPKEIQGTYGILKSYDEAYTKFIDSNKPYFYKESDILLTGDGIRIVVSSQWVEWKTDKVMQLAQRLKYHVEKFKSLL